MAAAAAMSSSRLSLLPLPLPRLPSFLPHHANLHKQYAHPSSGPLLIVVTGALPEFVAVALLQKSLKLFC